MAVFCRHRWTFSLVGIALVSTCVTCEPSEDFDDQECAKSHVRLHGGHCVLSWEEESGSAIKPQADVAGVHNLGRVDDHFIQRLRKLVETLPANAWKEPTAQFTRAGDVPIDYRQVLFHFPVRRGREDSPFYVYPLAEHVHPWIEPFLLNITRRYNYGHILEQRPGYLYQSIPRLFIARLGPGQAQSLHMDRGKSSWNPHKIHVPITADDAVIEVCHTVDGETGEYSNKQERRCKEHKFDQGFAYELNNLFLHAAKNSGKTNRDHLLFEYLPKDVSSRASEQEPTSHAALRDQQFEIALAQMEHFSDKTQESIRLVGDRPPADDVKGLKGYFRRRDSLTNELVQRGLLPSLEKLRNEL